MRRTHAQRISATGFVAAAPEVVSARYRDVARWPALFPTIASARILSQAPHRITVQVTHRQAGDVLNRLTWRSPRRIVLRESRRCFDAVFANRFDGDNRGTRYTVDAILRFRGACRLLACVPVRLRTVLVRRRLERFVLQPMRAAFEQTCVDAHDPHATS